MGGTKEPSQRDVGKRVFLEVWVGSSQEEGGWNMTGIHPDGPCSWLSRV